MERNENDELDAVTVTIVGDHRDNHNKEGRAVTITAVTKSTYIEKYENYLADAKTAASAVSRFGRDMMSGFSTFQHVRSEDRIKTYTIIRRSVEAKLYQSSISCIRAAFPGAPDAAVEKFHDAYRQWLSRRKEKEQREDEEGAEGSPKGITEKKNDELAEAIELIIRAISSKKITAISLARLRQAVLSVDSGMKKGTTDISQGLERHKSPEEKFTKQY